MQLLKLFYNTCSKKSLPLWSCAINLPSAPSHTSVVCESRLWSKLLGEKKAKREKSEVKGRQSGKQQRPKCHRNHSEPTQLECKHRVQGLYFCGWVGIKSHLYSQGKEAGIFVVAGPLHWKEIHFSHTQTCFCLSEITFPSLAPP